MNDHASSSSPNAKRKRTTKKSATGRRKVACQTCRLRKVACDRRRPQCSLCQSSGSECRYLNEVADDLTLSRAVELLSNQIHGLSEQVVELRASYVPTVAQSPANVAPAVIPPSYLASPHSFEQVHPQLSRNFSEIPPHKTTADTILTWPVFESIYPQNFFIEQLLGKSDNPMIHNSDLPHGVNVFELSSAPAPLDEQRIPGFVDKFLENVHTKNPILNVEDLVRRSRECAQSGVGWDASACLIMIACALGIVARPFGSELEALNDEVPLSMARQITGPTKERLQAENCFVLACRRFGLLQPSIMAAQCHFFAGVYLMYTLRPMIAWQHFHQASIAYQLYLKMNGRLSEDHTILVEPHSHNDHDTDYRKSRLEQRLYWSCFKSECEFRVELPLPQSEISTYEYPNLFPSPPSPVATDTNTAYHSPEHRSSHASIGAVQFPSSPIVDEQIDDTRLHAKKLCNEEESWYYYLTEVALRRIGNRIINTFFRHDHSEWLHIEPFLDLAIECEAQVSSWSANLPPAMQKYETNSTIRAPQIASADGAESGFVSQELSWATENRLLEMRSWLYQPFLYYLVHTRPPKPADVHLTRDSVPSVSNIDSPSAVRSRADSVFWNLILRAIDCNLAILDTRSVPHRHHGLWYDLRAIVSASLILLAVIKSGYSDLIPGGITVLVGHDFVGISSRRPTSVTSSHDYGNVYPIRGKFGKVLRQLDIWSNEAADMVLHRNTLEQLIRQTVVSGPT